MNANNQEGMLSYRAAKKNTLHLVIVWW